MKYEIEYDDIESAACAAGFKVKSYVSRWDTDPALVAITSNQRGWVLKSPMRSGRRHSKGYSTIIVWTATKGEMIKKVNSFALRMKEHYEAQEAALAESRAADQKRKDAADREAREWVGLVRCSFGGEPSEPLSDSERPTYLSNSDILLAKDYRRGIKVPLPENPAKRAEFIYLLEKFLERNFL